MITSDYDLFANVVQAGSLSGAGRKLMISPAMVSKRLARLEERLGVRLMHRTTRRLTLTGPGERFYEDVIHILHTIAEAESRVTGMGRDPSGLLRVSAPTSFGRLYVAPYLHRILEQFPKIDLEFNLSDEELDLYQHDIDLAVRITSDVPNGVRAHRLAKNHRVLCASPAYLEQHGTPADVDDLEQHCLIAANGQLPWRLANRSRTHLVQGPSNIRTNSSEVARELALGGFGVAYRSLWDVGAALKDGKLVPVLRDWGAPNDLWIYAMHPESPVVSPATIAFVDFLKKILNPAPWMVAN